MERRRKALGLKSYGITPEKPKSSRRTCAGESSKSSSDDITITRGKTSDRSQPACNMTPKQKTPISRRKETPLKSKSPSTPLQSPSALMVFPGTLASPEIEVSWDWSCSQVPNDMLPPKTIKQGKDSKMPAPVLPSLAMQPRRRPPLQRFTEEENQQRLEFYKSILAPKPSEGSSDVLYDATNNNVEDTTSEITKQLDTPKRPTTRLSSSLKKRNDENSLFDDSANEFMIECSQAIEEKLKNGEIDMGPIVDIKISQSKRLHSPGVDSNSHKKTCHGRVNLFPDAQNRGGVCSKDNVQNNNRINSNVTQEPSNSNSNKNNSKIAFERTEKPGLKKSNVLNSTINDAVISNASKDKIPPVKYSQNTTNKANICNSENRNKVFHTLNSNNSKQITSTLRNFDQSSSNQSSKNCSATARNSGGGRFQTTGNITQVAAVNSDITSLLDDDFDLELSCLDVDSLCSKGENNKLENSCATSSTPKMCTQQEIEAKRQAALQKLMMKKKR